MDDRLKTHLFAYLEKLEELARKGSDFAAEQTPLVLQEYITYSRVSSTVGLATGMLLLLVAVVFAKLALNKDNWPKGCEFPHGAAYTVVSVLLLILPVPILLLGNTDACIKSWTAPRVLLIEKLNELRR